ncbi:MAG: YicC family protein [Muribaculaceae bacterium]|nr:YicC family protein [Muribaculaceae bacterium]
MIFSMTGFGKVIADFNQKKITVEIKSLNSKQLDLSLRVPSCYREKELELRSEVAKIVERGKADMFITVTSSTTGEIATINTSLLREYKENIESISKELGIPTPTDWYSTLFRMPNVFTPDTEVEISDEESKLLRESVIEACNRLNEFRQQEGAKLQKFFTEKIENIAKLLDEVEIYEKERIPAIKARIEESLSKLKETDYDKNRFEQEMIYYIEKLDVTEEKTRLSNHLNYFIETMNAPKGQGKKLGFIAQEMGREINTLGSKSNHAEMQKVVVKMKDELDQIKEQGLNVL